MQEHIVISIVIVTFRVRKLLERCLDSLQDAQQSVSTEIIVVDNGSDDGTCEYLKKNRPDIHLIRSKTNEGFGAACNRALQQVKGKYVLFLNPDTLVQTNILDVLSQFLEQEPDCGIVGPKILNPDGKLQLACRRSFPTPVVALSRLLGLSRLFPNSRFWGRYNLTYLDADQGSEVDAVSGSCMMVRKQVLDDLGGFDEDFFMYGEDLDLCHRVKAAGWKVQYLPSTQVVHFKGESSRQVPLQSLLAFYNAMLLFSRKHVRSRHTFVPGWILYVGVFLNAGMGLVRLVSANLPLVLLDSLILNAALSGTLIFWFSRIQMETPYQTFGRTMLLLHAGFSMIWLICLAVAGAYRNRQQWALRSVQGCLAASFGSLAMVYLFNALAFSRVAFVLTSLVSLILIPGWRRLVDRAGALARFMPQNRVLVVGTAEQIVLTLRALKKRKTLKLAGFLTNDSRDVIRDAEYLGKPSDIAHVVREHRIDEVIVFENEISYTRLIETIASAMAQKPMIHVASIDREERLQLANLLTSTFHQL